MLKIFPAEKMNAYPVSKDMNQPGPDNISILKLIGDRLCTEKENKFTSLMYAGGKLKDAANWTWRGNEGNQSFFS